MACGRAAYVLDVVGGDGWVTGERYAAMEADNFAGHVTDWSLDRERLVADLAGYRQDMGQVNRDLVLAHHDARSHAYELVALFRRLRPRPSSPTSPSCRGSRSARRRWWAPDPSSRGTCARARFVLGSPARFLRDVSDAELLERHAPPG